MAPLPIRTSWWGFRIRGVTLRGTVQQCAHRDLDAPSVVAVHGGPGVDGGGLRHVLAPLAEQVTLVVPDLRGHGRSDLAGPDTWTLDDWSDDLAGVISALGLQRPVIVGVSFGGWVVLRHAARHPEQPGAVLVAATSARLPTVDGGVERMRELGGDAAAWWWRAAHDDPAAESTSGFRDHVLSLMAVGTATDELSAVRAAQLRTPVVNQHFLPSFATLDLTPDARVVCCPLTLVVGERDPLTTPDLAAATVDAVPGRARLCVLPGVAHDLLVDAPERLLAEIGRLLGHEVRRAAPPARPACRAPNGTGGDSAQAKG